MRDLNYHHLLYFWMTARTGSVTAAAQRLELSQPTISAQLRQLERRLGTPLFTRSGRKLLLTDAGRAAYRYADEIFALGEELLDAMEGRPAERGAALDIGVADVLPKLIAYKLVEPAVKDIPTLQLRIHEGNHDELLTRLAMRELDIVLSDAPLNPQLRVRAFNHLLGESPAAAFAAPSLARKLRRDFPASLAAAPLLLPTRGRALRAGLQRWFEQQGVRPRVRAEIEDSALTKVFCQAGHGVFFAPAVISADICRQYNVEEVGRLDDVRERVFAVSIEKRIRNPAAAAIAEAARDELFA